MVRVFCILLFCPLVASSITLSLTDIAPRVRAHHPALKAARLSIDEARGRQLGAGRLSNPTLDTSFQNESRVSPRTTVFGIDQSFPLTKRLSLEKQLTRQLVTAAEHEVRDVERRYIAVARSLAVKLLALDQQRALRQQQTALAQKLADFAKDRAKAGELSPLDAAQAQVDGQRLLLEARRLEIEAVSLRGELKPMLGLKPQDTLALSGQLPSLALPPSQAWQKRPITNFHKPRSKPLKRKLRWQKPNVCQMSVQACLPRASSRTQPQSIRNAQALSASVSPSHCRFGIAIRERSPRRQPVLNVPGLNRKL
jgi:outer membrane protein, heavy metal efflux system